MQERLLLLLASERLDVDIFEVRQRLAQLTMIVPDLSEEIVAVLAAKFHLKFDGTPHDMI